MAQNNKHFFSVSVGWEFRSSLAGWFLAGPASPEGLTGLRIYFQEDWLTWLLIGGYSSSLAVGRKPHFLSTKTAPQGFLSDPRAWQLVFPRINDPKESQNYDIPRKSHTVIPIISHWRHRKALTVQTGLPGVWEPVGEDHQLTITVPRGWSAVCVTSGLQWWHWCQKQQPWGHPDTLLLQPASRPALSSAYFLSSLLLLLWILLVSTSL